MKAANVTPSSTAWGFVLQHAAMIATCANRAWTDRRMDVEDFHHELIVDIARNHHKFDPARAGARTWVYLRARYVKDHALRALSARKDRAHGTRTILAPDEIAAGTAIDPVADAWGCHEAITVQVELSQVLGMATPLMADAARSHLEGWTGADVTERFGCTISARNDRLRRLGMRASAR